jgi:hypothetical protein
MMPGAGTFTPPGSPGRCTGVPQRQLRAAVPAFQNGSFAPPCGRS